jgi:hypothetical protein
MNLGGAAADYANLTNFSSLAINSRPNSLLTAVRTANPILGFPNGRLRIGATIPAGHVARLNYIHGVS